MRLRVKLSESQGITVARTLDLPGMFAAGEDDETAMASLLQQIEGHFTRRNEAAGAGDRRSRRHVLDLDAGRWRCVLCRVEFEDYPPDDAVCEVG